MRTQSFGHIKTLPDAIEALPLCQTPDDFEALAQRIDESSQPAEFNFHADVIMLVDALLLREEMPTDIRECLRRIQEAGEQGMLQLALMNRGIQAPSPFIIKAHEAGWRYLTSFKNITPNPFFEL